ncbi:MAG TPA: DUF4350 domain-containing protein [Mycobacteriales bacterium]|nr:DUF4350 domain-containing protein [Mycobacteriales bacterium]
MTAQPAPATVAAGPWVRRFRGPAIFVVVGIGLVALLAAVGRASNSNPLDPRNAAPDGTRALAALLAARGDTFAIADRVSQLSGAAEETIVLSSPRAATDDSLRAVARGRSTVVVVEPDDRVLAALGVDATLVNVAPSGDVIEPGCSLPAAAVAGTARVSGFIYRAAPAVTGVTACYFGAGGASLLVATRPSGGRTTVIGTGGTLTNAHLAAEGDAALALGLLDNRTVEWVPGGLQPASAPGSRQGLLNLLPPRLLWATLQLFLAVVVLALWRVRRLGPLVAEPLPVVVRAAETVEGSGRLLHAARARAGAAAALRGATIGRLARLLRIAPDGGANAITPVVAEQTGRPPAAVHTLLYGDAPGDDAGLVQLAGELASLESAARRSTQPGGSR